MIRTDFGRLWMAQSVSALGSRITRTALPVLAVLSVDGTPLELGILSAVTVGPGALVALLASGRIDRARKRPVLVAADLVRAVLILSLPLAAWLGALTMPQLYVVAALVGTASALFSVTDNAYLVHLVPPEELTDKNAKLETTESIAEIVGPGLAGLLIEWITAPFAMLVDAVSYLGSALLLSRIRAEEIVAETETTASVYADLRSGLSAVWSEPRVRPHFLTAAIQTLADGFFFALYMIFALDTLQISVGAVGVIISMGGVGALFGALLSRFAGSRGGLIFTFGIAMASMILIPLADGSWIGIACLVAHQIVSDGFEIAYQVHAVTHRQVFLDRAVLARANGIFAAVTTLLLPVVALGAGALAERIGVREALYVGVALALLAPLPLLALPRDLAATGLRSH